MKKLLKRIIDDPIPYGVFAAIFLWIFWDKLPTFLSMLLSFDGPWWLSIAELALVGAIIWGTVIGIREDQ